MTENRIHLQKYAMHFGTYMGAYWILKFILFPIGLTIPFLLFLFLGLTLGVPFMGYYYTRMYRNKICGGEIRFVHAWLFTVFMYMFAALLTAMAHFLYFRFLDHGYIIATYTSMLNGALQANLPGMETYIVQLKDAMATVRMLSPIQITLQLLSQNIFYGSILAIPTALIVMKRKKTA
ncbi:DUF4199 domain-containing protein [uncultured Bacteroides sp.]|uniref:DUF4199 domain-containing protein n=1 Tax=uncultured Bacteroides sp. TaxID=162156 RepID=UPI002AA77BE3|nr:DUF4199 domain-containing protein [uncultured Bacteroides sp.]